MRMSHRLDVGNGCKVLQETERARQENRSEKPMEDASLLFHAKFLRILTLQDAREFQKLIIRVQIRPECVDKPVLKSGYGIYRPAVHHDIRLRDAGPMGEHEIREQLVPLAGDILQERLFICRHLAERVADVLHLAAFHGIASDADLPRQFLIVQDAENRADGARKRLTVSVNLVRNNSNHIATRATSIRNGSYYGHFPLLFDALNGYCQFLGPPGVFRRSKMPRSGLFSSSSLERKSSIAMRSNSFGNIEVFCMDAEMMPLISSIAIVFLLFDKRKASSTPEIRYRLLPSWRGERNERKERAVRHLPL